MTISSKHFVVGGDTTRWFFLDTREYIPADLGWLSMGFVPSYVNSETEIWAMIAADVEAEASRRLSIGFDYDFGDERGVHHFGTTDKDMKGWDEVSTWALTEHALGLDTSTLAIVTDTGGTLVTPLEWFAVLQAATSFRQPIWAASFRIATTVPIPADFRTNEALWS